MKNIVGAVMRLLALGWLFTLFLLILLGYYTYGVIPAYGVHEQISTNIANTLRFVHIAVAILFVVILPFYVVTLAVIGKNKNTKNELMIIGTTILVFVIMRWVFSTLFLWIVD